MKAKNKIRLSKHGKQAETALKRAVAKIVQEHKRKKIPLAVWRNNQVVKIQP